MSAPIKPLAERRGTQTVVNFPLDQLERIEIIRIQSGLAKAEIVRRAVALYCDHVAAGGAL